MLADYLPSKYLCVCRTQAYLIRYFLHVLLKGVRKRGRVSLLVQGQVGLAG